MNDENGALNKKKFTIFFLTLLGSWRIRLCLQIFCSMGWNSRRSCHRICSYCLGTVLVRGCPQMTSCNIWEFPTPPLPSLSFFSDDVSIHHFNHPSQQHQQFFLFTLPTRTTIFRSAEGLYTNDVMQYMKIYLFRDNVSVNHPSQQQQQSIFLI
jgi:hypothetical protein